MNEDLTNREHKNYEIERKFLLSSIPKYVLDNAFKSDITVS